MPKNTGTPNNLLTLAAPPAPEVFPDLSLEGDRGESDRPSVSLTAVSNTYATFGDPDTVTDAALTLLQHTRRLIAEAGNAKSLKFPVTGRRRTFGILMGLT